MKYYFLLVILAIVVVVGACCQNVNPTQKEQAKPEPVTSIEPVTSTEAATEDEPLLLLDDEPLLLLDDEPDEDLSSSGPMADNSRCFVCHVN